MPKKTIMQMIRNDVDINRAIHDSVEISATPYTKSLILLCARSYELDVNDNGAVKFRGVPLNVVPDMKHYYEIKRLTRGGITCHYQ